METYQGPSEKGRYLASAVPPGRHPIPKSDRVRKTLQNDATHTQQRRAKKNLKSLDLSNYGVQDNAALPAVVPAEVFELVQLEVLDLRNNRLTSIPADIGRLSNLISLDLRGNDLAHLPDNISELPVLRSLNLSGNMLTSVPDSLRALSHLTELSLSGNQINLVPDWIAAELTALAWLSLGHNELTKIPASMGELKNLVRLDLGGNRLTDLPAAISRLKVRELILANNCFTSIPDCVYSIVSLRSLDLSNSNETLAYLFGVYVSKYKESRRELYEAIEATRKRLTSYSMPEQAVSRRLRDLARFALQARKNVIKTISPLILRLINLEKLSLDTASVEVPPPEVVQRGIEAIKKYFRQLESQGVDFLYEAKFLIVGEAGAGKTSLAKKIENPAYQLREDEGSTQGIDVIRWYFDREDGTKFQVNIWDFGGQEIYHATHQFFLTKRSLYALVADDRKEDTDFYYWLNVVELLSDGSPVLIVKNEKLDRHRDINERQLRGQFTNLKATVSTNLATNRRLVEIVDAVKYHIQQLPHVGIPLPKTWVRVREALEKDSRDYISADEFFKICEQNGFTKLEDKRQLSGYLHDLGVCLHFQEDPLLEKIVILKPKWGTDAVYKALDDETVVTNRGRFTRADLSKIWIDPKHANMQNELLQLMINFKLCYRIPDSEEVYIAPQLLTANQPSYDWDEAENLILRYDYQFMPKGILTRFIVSMHPFISEQGLVWKSGVILEKDQTKAEVIEQYDKREIRIRVRGKYRKDLMTIINYELEKIHGSYKRLDCNVLIPCNCGACKNSQAPDFYPFHTLREWMVCGRQQIQCRKSGDMVEVCGLIDDVIDKDRLQTQEKNRGFVFNAPIGTVVVQQAEEGANVMIKAGVKEEIPSNKHKDAARPVKSAWANGLFYLLCFAVVVGGLGVLAGNVPWYAFVLIIIAAILFVPLIGVLQLYQDERLSEKSFVDLVKLVVRQLPLIGKIAAKTHVKP